MHRLLIVLALLFAAPAAADPWVEDFEALKSGFARNYANFEQNIVDRRVDLPAVARDHEARLQAAPDDAAKRRGLESLAAQFRDPHVRIEWAEGGGGAGSQTLPCLGPGAPEVRPGGLRWERHPDFRPLDGPHAAPFRAGLLGTDGVIRIPIFLEQHFTAICRAAAAELAIPLDRPCAGDCQGRLDRRSGRMLNDALRAALAELERAGARRLVVDLTDNPGGSDWVESVLRILGGPIDSAEIAMLRHPAWTAQLDDTRRELDALIAGAAGESRSRLVELRARIEAAEGEVGVPCDLSAAWTDSKLALGLKPLPCSTLVRGVFYATGLERSAEGVPEDDVILFSAARYGPYDRATRLPLLLLVSENSHSSAELFVAALRDHGRAIVVGTTTPGAGCGQFTGRGTSFTLPNSGATVHVPDCVRLRSDGTSERRGIVPDLLVPWGPADSAWMRLEKAVAAIRAVP